MAYRQPTTSRAFSLIELLVVIGILCILASILLPSISKVKEKARNIQCLSNLRQVNVTWSVYSIDNDKLVANGFLNEGPHPEKPYWVQGYLNHVVSNDLTNNTLLLDNRYALFGDYLKTPKIYKCPSDKVLFNIKSSKTIPDKVSKHRSYALNWYLGMGEKRRDFSDEYIMLRENEIFIPSLTFTFVDTNPKSVCWPIFGVMGGDFIYMYPNSSHLGSGNIAFADNHIISKKWTDIRTKIGSTNWHAHYDYSPNNPDLAWLQNNCGVKF